MLRLWLAAAAMVAMTTGAAVAQISSASGPTGSQQPGVGEPLMILSSGAIVTGSLDWMATPDIRTSGNQGPPMFNGDGAGMTVPGAYPKLMSAPE